MNKPIILTGWNNRKVNHNSVGQRGNDCDCDCDCACENFDSLYSVDVELGSKWVAVKQAYPILSSKTWTTIFNPMGPVAISVVNKAGFDLWQSFEKGRVIDQIEFKYIETAKIMARIGLLRQPNKLNSLTNIHQSKVLSAWLHVTNACNLRCDYCYLHKTTEGMSQEIAFASLKTLFDSAQRHNYQFAKIKYAGGEPFICFELLREIHYEANRLKQKYGIGLEEVVISNGTLIKEDHIDFLLDQNISLSISLDGIGDAHDQQRAHVNGKGSFAEIEKTLLLCREKKYYPHITITVTDRNAEYLAQIADYLLEMGLHFNFNFYRENDCSASFQDLKLGEEKIINGIKRAYRAIEKKLPEWSLLGALADRSSFISPHTHTCSVGRDYMVIDHYGQISKCQMTIGLPITNIYSNEPLTAIRNDKLGLQNVSVEEKEGCKTCEWKNWCAGGCSLATYRTTGRYDAQSPNCNIYKAIYPELLRLESLRLIKYSEYDKAL